MKIIDAFWEKRNLGVDSCLEITIEDGDVAADAVSHISDLRAEYMVLKVPSHRSDFLFEAPKAGFTFVECSINVTHDLKSHLSLLKGPKKRLMDAVSYRKMSESEYDTLFHFLRKGIFDTDRVYLDPHFTHEQAANRYVGWIGDELERGCGIYAIVYKDADIGFFTNKLLANGAAYPFLSGLYDEYKGRGFGAAINVKQIEASIALGARGIDSYVSSNNTVNLRESTMLGFVINGINYIFVKHYSA